MTGRRVASVTHNLHQLSHRDVPDRSVHLYQGFQGGTKAAGQVIAAHSDLVNVKDLNTAQFPN